MMRDLKTLGRLGILVYDIKAGAYVDGKISDLSQAHTVPHFRLLGSVGPGCPKKGTRATWTKRYDYKNFDAMIEL